MSEEPPIPEPGKEPAPTPEEKPVEFDDFVKGVSDLFAAGLVDPITDETRKSQRALMLISLALVLLASGVVGTGQTATVSGLVFSYSPKTLIWVGIAACGYLEAFAALKCTQEWRLYKLKAPREKQLWEIFHDLKKAKLKYSLQATTPSARDAYVEQSRLASEKMRWFTDQFVSLGSIQKAKLVIDVAFPLFAGVVAMIYAAWALYGMSHKP